MSSWTSSPSKHASEPQVAPDGKRVVYVRNFMDVMKDKRRSNLWIINVSGAGHQALTTGNHADAAPRFSPDGSCLLFVSDRSGTAQLHSLWLDTGRTAQLTRPLAGPINPARFDSFQQRPNDCACRGGCGGRVLLVSGRHLDPRQLTHSGRRCGDREQCADPRFD